MINDVTAIDESEYPVDELTPESEAWTRLWAKHMQRYTTRAKFWAPRIKIGKQCSRFERRDIFTPKQRAKYLKVENKWPIEPQEMKPVIATLEKLIEKGVPGSDITFEDDTPAPNAAQPDTVKTVISMMKHKLKIHDKRKKVLHKGLVVGYPICLMAEYTGGMAVPGAIPLRFSVLPWDSVLPKQYYTSEDGEDIDDVIIVKWAEEAELLRTYPKRKKAFKQYQEVYSKDEGFQKRLLDTDVSSTATDRSDRIYQMVSEAKFNSQGGQYFVMESRFPIVKKRRVWINSETLDVIIPPPTWDEARTEAWLQENPGYDNSAEVDVKTSWVTTISSDGFVWENKESWYQEDGALPCAWYIADTVDNLPTGLGEDMLPYILMIAACETEGLSQVRKGSGTTTFISEGVVVNPERLGSELSAEDGVVLLKKGSTPRENVMQTNKQPNTTFLDLAEREGRKLANVHRISDAAMGATINRQSVRAKQAQVEQTLAPQARYVDNFQSFTLQIENLLCKLIPRVLTEQMVVQIKDEYGMPTPEVTVNQTGYDAVSGEAKVIANDLTSERYRAEPVIGDDSATSRETQMSEFMDVMTAVGNQLFKLDPRMLASVLNVFPNRFAKEAAKFIAENGEKAMQSQQAAQQAELDYKKGVQAQRKEIDLAKINTPKASVRFAAEDIANAPMGAKLLYSMMQEAITKNEMEGSGVGEAPEQYMAQPTEGAGNEEAMAQAAGGV